MVFSYSRMKHKQSGFVLAVSMIFLVVMTLLAVAAIKKSTLDEKIAFNLRAQNMSFQAAEKALRFCERGLILKGGSLFLCQPDATSTIPAFLNSNEGDPMDASKNFPTLWMNSENWKSGGPNAATQLPYGTVDSVPGLSAEDQPRCMIEGWPINPNTGSSTGTSKFPAWVITARAGPKIDVAESGKGEIAVVWLQEIIRCGNI